MDCPIFPHIALKMCLFVHRRASGELVQQRVEAPWRQGRGLELSAHLGKLSGAPAGERRTRYQDHTNAGQQE